MLKQLSHNHSVKNGTFVAKKQEMNTNDEDEVPAQIADVLNDDQAEFMRSSAVERSMLKMLVSENAAGAIIGKGGSAISQMQEESGARIKVSQSNDFYPNSRERTLLISGPVESIIVAQQLIWEKVAQVNFYASQQAS